MALDVSRLRVLAEVARHGSMTGAATALSYTLSAVSQQIRKLELDVGQPLLERHARGVTLTDAGHAVVEHIALIERQLDALDARLADLAGLRAGSLRLGSFPTVGASVMPLAVTKFKKSYPDVSLSLSSARLSGLYELLETRAVDMALLWDYSWSRVSDPGLVIEPLMNDPTALVVSASHRLARQSSVAIADLRNEKWIIRADSHPVAEVLRRSAHKAGFEPTVAFAAHDYQEAQAMVAVGMGVALAPRLALVSLREDVRVLSLEGDAPARRILLARLSSRMPAPPEMAMSAILKEVCRDLAAADGR